MLFIAKTSLDAGMAPYDRIFEAFVRDFMRSGGSAKIALFHSTVFKLEAHIFSAFAPSLSTLLEAQSAAQWEEAKNLPPHKWGLLIGNDGAFEAFGVERPSARYR